jgi:hypothetical protein
LKASKDDATATRVIIELIRFGVKSENIDTWIQMLGERGNRLEHSKLVLDLLGMGVAPENLSLCFQALDVRSSGAEDQEIIFEFDARLLLEFIEYGVSPSNLILCFQSLALRGTSAQEKANYQLDAALISKYLRAGMNPCSLKVAY